MLPNQLTDNTETIPPIVLFLGDDADLYVDALESDGLWVSTANDPEEALATANELRPDIVVAAISRSAARYDEVVKLLKRGQRTKNIPLLLLSNTEGDSTAAGSDTIDLRLKSPVAAETLVHSVRELVQRSRQLRARGDEARARAKVLVNHSMMLLKDVDAPKPESRTDRPCPKCGATLSWIERGRLAGVEYDYFRWCRSGCGLYCYDCAENTWVKLT